MACGRRVETETCIQCYFLAELVSFVLAVVMPRFDVTRIPSLPSASREVSVRETARRTGAWAEAYVPLQLAGLKAVA